MPLDQKTGERSLCKELDLFGAELLVVDGSKFAAQNSKDKNFTRAKLERLLKAVDEKIENYLEELEHSDAQEAPVKKPTATELMEKIQALEGRKERYDQLLHELEKQEAEGETQLSLTDADSRSMPKSPKVDVGFNVQVAVDSRHKLVVEQAVTNAVTDQNQLSTTAIAAKETLGVDTIDLAADRGYYDGPEVKTCEAAGITCYIAKPLTSANQKQGLFTKEDFRYDKDQDGYLCPAGSCLTFRFDTVELGRHIRYYATPACKGCSLREQCTRNKGGRRITRWVDEHLLEAMAERVKNEPEKLRLRKQVVEHPFGTIKRGWDAGYFLMRGLEKVKGEFSLTALCYNLRRAITIVGVAKLLEVAAAG